MTTIDSSTPARTAGGVVGFAEDWLEPLIRVTALVVFAEALLLRGATRVFIHIPGLDVTSGALGRLADFARIAFRMAVPLTFALLFVLIFSRWGMPTGRRSGVLVGAFLAAIIIRRFADLGSEADWLVLGLVASVAVISVLGLGTQARVPVAAWSAAYLMIGVVQLLDQQVADGAGNASLPWLGGFAEAVALLALLTSPLLLRTRLSRLDWAIGAVVALLLALTLLGAESQAAAKILILWNLGWSGGYPMIVYAVAIATLAMTITALVRQRRITTAASLIFLGAAGFGMFSSYQTALMMAGLVLVTTRSKFVGNDESSRLVNGAVR